MLRIYAVVAALVLSSCASYRPIVDERSMGSRAQYEQDLLECQRYAEQVDVAGESILWTIGGAVLGGALAAATGDTNFMSEYVATGAVAGLATGASEGASDQKSVIKRCLAGRGYRVLR